MEEVVNHAQKCEGKITPLFEIGLTHDRTAFFSLSSSPAETALVCTPAYSFSCRGNQKLAVLTVVVQVVYRE